MLSHVEFGGMPLIMMNTLNITSNKRQVLKQNETEACLITQLIC